VSTRAKSFWSTMPGLITGLAGILTGLVGLGTLLIQLEVIGGDGDPTPKFEPGRTATTRAGGSQPDGTAAVVRFAVSPSSLDVTTNKTESVTVENTGTKVLSVQQPVLSGSGKDQFTVRSDCGQLQVDDTCTVTVTFKGLLNASAIMTVRAGDGASPKEVTLEGRPV
jgi:hypothetical protein